MNNENLIDLNDLNMSDEELFSHIDNSSIESEKITAPRYSYWKSVFRVFFKKKINTVILAILAIVILFTYVYPIFANYSRFENLNTEGGKHLNTEKAITKYIYNANPEKYTLSEAKDRYFDNRKELRSRLTAFFGLDEDCSGKELSAAISDSADKFLHDLYINKPLNQAYSEYIPCANEPSALASALVNFATANEEDSILEAIEKYTDTYKAEVYGTTKLQVAVDDYNSANANAGLVKLLSDKYEKYIETKSDDSKKPTKDQLDFTKYFENVKPEQMTDAVISPIITENAELSLADCAKSDNVMLSAIAGYLLNSDNATIIAVTEYFKSEDASKTLDELSKDRNASVLSATLSGFLTGTNSHETGDEALKKLFSGNIASMTLDECIASGDTLPGVFAKFFTEYYYGKITFIDVCADFFDCADSNNKTVASAMVAYIDKTDDQNLKAAFDSYLDEFVGKELSAKPLSFAVYAAMSVNSANDLAAQNLVTAISLNETAKPVVDEYVKNFFDTEYSKKSLEEVFSDSFTEFSLAEDKRVPISEHDLALRIATNYNNRDLDGDGQAEFSVSDPEKMVSEISDLLSMSVEKALNSDGLAKGLATEISKNNIVGIMAIKDLLDRNGDKSISECLESDGVIKVIAELVTDAKYHKILTATATIDGAAGKASFIDCKAGTGVSSLANAVASHVEDQSFYNKKTLAAASADFMSCPVYADKLTEAFSRMLFSSTISRCFESIRWILGAGGSGESTFDAIWYGSEISISLALLCAAINMTVGVIIGAVWGFSKTVDVIMTEVYNIIGNVPYILFISVMVLIFSPNFWTMVFALTITGWLGIAYFIRTQVIIIRDREYNLASRCLGTPLLRLTVKNILPFMTSVIVTLVATEIPSYISYEVFLSYIGMGMSSNGPLSLGKLIYNAEPAMLVPDWSLEFWSPVVIASIITVVLYVVGQNLGDASDPRTHM